MPSVKTPQKPPTRIVKRKQRNVYWTNETEQSILKYQAAYAEGNTALANKIFTTELYKPFYDMVTNVFRVHRFNAEGESYDDIFHDAVVQLWHTLPKYDATKGFVSFAYFNRCTVIHFLGRHKLGTVRNAKFVYTDEPDTKYDTLLGTAEPYVNPDETYDAVLEVFASMSKRSIPGVDSNRLAQITKADLIEIADGMPQKAVQKYLFDLLSVTTWHGGHWKGATHEFRHAFKRRYNKHF